VHVKCKQVQHKEIHGQVLAAVAEVVIDMVALVFEGIEGLVFDFPSRPSAFDQLDHVVFINGNIGHPAISVGDFVFRDQLVLEKIDIIGVRSAVEGNTVDPSIAVPSAFFVGKLKAAAVAQCMEFVDPFEQYLVIVGFGHEDVRHSGFFLPSFFRH